MQNHKGFRRFICVTVLCALLMVSMGRATRVSAVGTTAVIAGTAFVLTGAVYLSYIALTQGQIRVPAADGLNMWLEDIGRTVSQYPSGAAAYSELYQGLLRDPFANVIDGVWTWTQDKLKSFANDFSDTRIIKNIVGYTEYNDLTQEVFNGYDYSTLGLEHVVEPLKFRTTPNGSFTDINQLILEGYQFNLTSPNTLFYTNTLNYWYIAPSHITNPIRNLLRYDGLYILQEYVDGQWLQVSNLQRYYIVTSPTNQTLYAYPDAQWRGYQLEESIRSESSGASAWPIAPQAVIHVQATDEDLPMTIPDEATTHLPTWVDPDNDNRPIIPWVPIPNIPTGLPTPPGYTDTPQWGFPLQDLLDLLEELARSIINIGAIGELINQFAGLHGDNYYLEYNDGDINYYTYYQPTIFDNDTEYVTYNIDISKQDDIVPVDLNTISLYTKNEYLDAVKQSARNFGDAIGEYVAFWHNSDYTLTYTILGGFVLILIGAFIGKWGHS